MVKLSIVIVNWNTKDLLKDCLDSVVSKLDGRVSYEIFVVDNASSDKSAAMVRSHFPTVHLIENSENVGFGRANNQASALASGEYILLLNSDTRLVGDDTDEVLHYLDDHPAVGIATGKMYYEDGVIHSSSRRFPGVVRTILSNTIGKIVP